MVALINKTNKKFSSIWLYARLGRLEKPLTALCIILGLILAAIAQSHAHTVDPLPPADQVAAVAQASPTTQPIEDGVYLYGQSPQPLELGSEYLVLEVNQNQVVGGFYMPNSSFDCFYGEVQSGQLNLNIINAYDQDVYPYTIALATDEAIAGSDPQAAPLNLVGFHRIDTLSAIDQEILNTCRADLQ